MLTFPVSAIGWTASMIQRASASQKRLNEFLNVRPSVNSFASDSKPDMTADIVLENVSFTYSHTNIEALKKMTQILCHLFYFFCLDSSTRLTKIIDDNNDRQ